MARRGRAANPSENCRCSSTSSSSLAELHVGGAATECSRADLMACCHQTIQPRSSLPPSSSHFLFSLSFFCQLSKLSQSILELKEGQNQCQGGDGHLRPGRGGGYGEHGATSSPFVCGSVLFHSWCSTFNQISLTEVSYLSKFHSLS